MTLEELRALPKVELHCHLDGSLSREFISSRLEREVRREELQVDEDCKSLAEYLEKFELPGRCIQDAAGLAGAGYDVLRTMSRENVCYAEIRFAPLLSVSEDFGTASVIGALLSGLERGREEFGVEYNVIVCAMRHHSQEASLGMLREAGRFLGKGVCAADLAGAEAQYPMAEFMELFREIRSLGMPFTIHAGECGSVQNVADALLAGAGRIGHGIAMRGYPEVQQMVRKARVGVEMCPISNLQTKAVPSPEEYPIREFLDAGLAVTVNTDNRTVSGTSLTKELAFIQSRYGVTDAEICQMMRNGIQTAFADEEQKQRIRRKLKA